MTSVFDLQKKLNIELCLINLTMCLQVVLINVWTMSESFSKFHNKITLTNFYIYWIHLFKHFVLNIRYLRTYLLVCFIACRQALGIENKGVADTEMASSSRLNNTHTSSHGRLYGATSWCSSTSSVNEYIQVDLGQVKTVTGIATQGDPTNDKWIKTYTIRYSLNGNSWNDYTGGTSSIKVCDVSILLQTEYCLDLIRYMLLLLFKLYPLSPLKKYYINTFQYNTALAHAQ